MTRQEAVKISHDVGSLLVLFDRRFTPKVGALTRTEMVKLVRKDMEDKIKEIRSYLFSSIEEENL